MDNVSKQLLSSLRARPYHELDEDDKETLELLEKEEAEYLAHPATPEDAARIGENRRSRSKTLPPCPKCGSEKMARRLTSMKLICKCMDCGNRYTAPVPGPVSPVHPPVMGPFAPAGGAMPEKPAGQGYYRNPKKTRTPNG